MKLTSFGDRSILQQIRIDINNAMQSVKEKYGIDVSIGNISFTAESFRTTMTARVLAENGRPKAKDYSEVFGYPPIGTLFTALGIKYEVVEHHPERPKFPIVAVKVGTESRYKFTEETVKNLIAIQALRK